MSANCSDPDAFWPAQHWADGAAPAENWILPAQRHGEGIFAGAPLDCDLGNTCCAHFDEALCPTTPNRVTPAKDALGVGEEYRVALGKTSSIKLITNNALGKPRSAG